jgi:hypothetical protein
MFALPAGQNRRPIHLLVSVVGSMRGSMRGPFTPGFSGLW